MINKDKIINKKRWHAVPAKEAMHILGSSPDGLSRDEARERMNIFGPNMLDQAVRRGPLTRFLLQFHNVLIYVLLAAAVITALLQEWVDSMVIFGVTIVNALIGFIQEGKAEKSLDSIKNMLAPKAVVLRDKERQNIPAQDLIPGDVVLLKAGDKVPADLRLFESKDLQIDESALTGESVPVSKNIYEVDDETSLGDRAGMAFSGTLVTYGQARGVVVATGQLTQIGRISSLLSQVDTLTTPLLRQVAKFGHFLTIAILALAGLTFFFGIVIRDYGAGEMFLAAVGLAVAAIPEGLPAIMTITLAIGVQRMARRNAIIRRLPAVETLGSVTIICSDKTGTLTKNEMTVQNIQTADRLYGVTGAGYSPQGEFTLDENSIDPQDHPILMDVLTSALLCNDALVRQEQELWKLDGAPTEGALVTAAMKAGLNHDRTSKERPRLDIVPFSSEKKFMATLNQWDDGQNLIILKGAPERVMEKCSQQRHQDKDQDLDRDFWHQQGERIASRGQRLLALAVKEVQADQKELGDKDLEQDFVFLGIFGIIDPPRQEAIEAAARLIGECVSVDECHSAGIRVKMITGDHVLTALSIAEKLGIGDGKTALTGQELEKKTDEELRQVVPDVDVFARTSPEHKLRLVKALQAENHIVAMTGDGVNDAPALKRADVGVAMGKNGTEAAKEASDMVLADDNFASIANAVEEGRTVYDNLKKAILFILPTNGGQALVVIASIILGIGLMDGTGHFSLPITPPQILWINMVTAVSLALALAFEPSEANVMKRPPRSPDENLVSGFLLWRVGFVSVLLVIGALGHYKLMLLDGASQNLAGTAAINTLVMGQVFYLFNSRFIFEPSWTIRGIMGSRPVLISIAVLAVLQLSFTYLPPMQYLFQTEGLDPAAWVRILIFGILVFILVEMEKAVFRKRR
ncbi:cation-transporting P-type ATPase [Desulfonatronovibrio hydrogenovorans]|uniref:cation-transporting P-type ATPase n=1 Tax=Desulfonatronovibrio hydrogenovorans TaxID=53245 RepID=UPI0006900ABC|nr:cation-transporting P-type ATPase [Desulfonatronovibrio hydrogenovorans]